MAKKSRTAVASKPSARAKRGAAIPSVRKGRRATIRMYRLGIGDCFLVSFPRIRQADFRVLIDCGVHQAQPGGSQRIKDTVLDLKKLTNGKIDVIVGTHEHQDHLSGFAEIQKQFGEACADEIWAAW